jgi:hypothetical protein
MYFPVWSMVWRFGIFCGHLVYFARFGMVYKDRSGNPDPGWLHFSAIFGNFLQRIGFLLKNQYHDHLVAIWRKYF